MRSKVNVFFPQFFTFFLESFFPISFFHLGKRSYSRFEDVVVTIFHEKNYYPKNSSAHTQRYQR